MKPSELEAPSGRALSASLPERFAYGLYLTAGVAVAVLAVFGGAFCPQTYYFDFHESLTFPFQFIGTLWYIAGPLWLVLSTVITPLIPAVRRRVIIATILSLPFAVYALIGGFEMINLYVHPYTGSPSCV